YKQGYNNYTSYSSSEQYGGYSGAGDYNNSNIGSGGGGFIKSEESSNTKSSQGSDRRNNNLRPVTIKQLHNATPINDSTMSLDGLELRVIKIVGVVIHKTPRPQGIDYMVDDGTGLIDVKVWHDASDETSVNQKIDIAINTYAKFFGNYRVFSSKKHFAAHIVRPIEDHNEISYHIADVIYSHLYLKKGSNNSSVSNSVNNNESQTRSSGDVGNQDPLQKDIFDLISKQNNTPMGADVSEIAQKLAFQYGSDQAVRFAIEDMIGDGRLYVTSDDNHVKTTGC
ncbi:5544_t:CDS:2, partial [Funneliformis geosporum]